MKTFNIFRWFRNQTGVRPKRVLPGERPAPVFKSRHGETYPIEESPPHAEAPLILGDLPLQLPMSACRAIQQSDEMYCADCGLRWDVNDYDRPACRRQR